MIIFLFFACLFVCIQVPDVICTRFGKSTKGTLHLTTHHLIFRDNHTKSEIWICYPIIANVERRYSGSDTYSSGTSSPSLPSPNITATLLSSADVYQSNSPVLSNTNHNSSTIRIRCKDFCFLAFKFQSDEVAKDVFDSIMKLTCVPSINKLYAFMYKPFSIEKTINGWDLYNPLNEFRRMGVLKPGSRWRISEINSDYKVRFFLLFSFCLCAYY